MYMAKETYVCEGYGCDRRKPKEAAILRHNPNPA